ncbi:MAG: hypothetical protein JWN44_1110 [Myxococcales bacterium]|nr:hypothetical protein [Myxococcales bacterium]
MRGTACLLLMLAALGGCNRKKQVAPEAAASSRPADFTERFDSKNGLLTLHFPAGFKASQDGKHSVILARNLPDGRDEAISFVAVPHPITNDLTKFSHAVQEAGASKLNKFHLDAQHAARCNGNDGMEVVGTWVDADSNVTITRKSCAFLHAGHGFAFSYSIPQELAAGHDALLHAIVEAAELK